MTPDRPLWLYLKLGPERLPSPSDTADVPQSLDDLLRLALMVREFPSDEGLRYRDAVRVPPRAYWEGAQIGHGESPLSVIRLQYGSPFEIVTEVPWAVVGTGGTLWFFLAQIERVWNMPQRIRVESKRLRAEEQQHQREYWEARAAALRAEEEYWIVRRAASGRHLQGSAEPPAFLGLEGVLTDSPQSDAHRLYRAAAGSRTGMDCRSR